jgi:quinol monooxygenase YgiN
MTIVTTAHLEFESKESRQKALSAFHKIVEYSRANEPGVLRYIVTLPIDDTKETEIYMIEEYVDKAASDAHLATLPVKDLIALFGQPGILAGAPKVWNITPSIEYARPQLKSLTVESSPAVVMAHFGFKSGTLCHAVEGWKELISYAEKNEPQTLGYTIMEDKESSALRTVEVYESWDFVKDVHLKSEAVKLNGEQNGNDMTGDKGSAKLKPVDGFFGKP